MAYSMDDLNKILEDLKRQRDELNVQLALGKAEARDEMEKLETKWEEVRAKMATVGDEASTTAQSVGEALGLAVDEIKAGYDRIRKAL